MVKIVIVLLSIILFFIFLFFSNEEVKNPIAVENREVVKKVTSSNPNKLTHNFKDNVSNTPNTFNKSNEVKNNISLKNSNSFVIKNNEIITKQTLKNFLDRNNLEEVENFEDIKVYAKKTSSNEFAPPSPPMFVKLDFEDTKKVIPLNSNILSNKKIYITKKIGDKYQVKVIDTSKLTSFAPPVIGNK